MNRDEAEKLIRDLRKPWTIAENMQPLIIQAADALDDALARLDDAEAAQALVVERAIKEGMRIAACTPVHQVQQAIDDAIRALAPASGVWALAALRADLTDMTADRDSWKGEVGHWMDTADDLRARLAAAEGQVGALRKVLAEGRRAIGDHFAPNDCYATGPLTGDPYRDLVECPACSFIAMHDAAIATHEPDALPAQTVTPPADTTEGRT